MNNPFNLKQLLLDLSMKEAPDLSLVILHLFLQGRKYLWLQRRRPTGRLNTKHAPARLHEMVLKQKHYSKAMKFIEGLHAETPASTIAPDRFNQTVIDLHPRRHPYWDRIDTLDYNNQFLDAIIRTAIPQHGAVVDAFEVVFSDRSCPAPVARIAAVVAEEARAEL